MGEQRCDCCDLPVYSCGKAQEEIERREEAALREQLREHPRWFPSIYPGTCSGCDGYFEVGTYIKRSGDKYVAQCCYSS